MINLWIIKCGTKTASAQTVSTSLTELHFPQTNAG